MNFNARLDRLEAGETANACSCIIVVRTTPDPLPPLLPGGCCPDCNLPVKGIRGILMVSLSEIIR